MNAIQSSPHRELEDRTRELNPGTWKGTRERGGNECYRVLGFGSRHSCSLCQSAYQPRICCSFPLSPAKRKTKGQTHTHRQSFPALPALPAAATSQGTRTLFNFNFFGVPTCDYVFFFCNRIFFRAGF